MISSPNCALPLFVFLFWLGTVFLPPAQAATFSTNAFTDAFVTTGPSDNLSDNNYGSAGALSLAAAGLPKGEFQTVMQFDLAGARASFDSEFGAGQWSIGSIQLQLTATAGNNPIFNAAGAGQFQVFWMPNDTWTEGTGSPSAPSLNGITFNSLESAISSPADESLGLFSYNGATSGATSYSLSLTPGLTADLLAGDDISFRLEAADSNVSYLINSRTMGANRPVFTITAVPEPSPLSLGGLGLAGVAGWTWALRRRTR